jgi:hypothetical protein
MAVLPVRILLCLYLVPAGEDVLVGRSVVLLICSVGTQWIFLRDKMKALYMA